MLTGLLFMFLFACRCSGFDEFPSVSGFLIELAEPETVNRKPPVRCGLPFILILAVYVFDSFGIGVRVGASQVDEPLGGVRSHPDAVAGVRVNNEKRVVCVAPVYGDRLDGNGLVGVDVKCGEHFFSFQGFRFLLDGLMIRQVSYEIKFGVSHILEPCRRVAYIGTMIVC